MTGSQIDDLTQSGQEKMGTLDAGCACTPPGGGGGGGEGGGGSLLISRHELRRLNQKTWQFEA